MNKKIVLFSIILATVSIVAASCNKNQEDKSDNPQNPFEDEDRPVDITQLTYGDDSFLEGEWLCTDFIFRNEEPLSKEWEGSGSTTFNTETKRYGRYDGCNHGGNGYYSFSPDSVLTFLAGGDGSWTQIGCSCHHHFGGAGKVRRFTQDDTESLEVSDENWKTILRRPGRWFLRGDWELAYFDLEEIINGSTVSSHEDIEDADITVSFNLENGTVAVTEKGVASFEMPFTTGPDCTINIDTKALKNSVKNLNNTWQRLIDFLAMTAGFDVYTRSCSSFIIFKDASGNSLFSVERIDKRELEYNT